MTLGELPPWFHRTFALFLGLVWGSFLNVVIYRLPRDMSVVRPASHCPACGVPISPLHNVPVLAWLALRGRAACCGAKVPARYPLVEAMGGLLSLAILEGIVFRLPDTVPFHFALAVYSVDLALALGLVAAAFIDLEHMLLPDSITLGATVLGVGTASLRDVRYLDSVLGAVVGFAIVAVPFVLIYPRVRGGKVGMGLGDAKLLAAAGAWFGWPGALFVLGAGAVQGTLATLGVLAVKGRIDEPEAVKAEREELKRELEQMSPEERAEVERELEGDPLLDEPDEAAGLAGARVPFGPFLALALLEHMFLGKDAALYVIGLVEKVL